MKCSPDGGGREPCPCERLKALRAYRPAVECVLLSRLSWFCVEDRWGKLSNVPNNARRSSSPSSGAALTADVQCSELLTREGRALPDMFEQFLSAWAREQRCGQLRPHQSFAIVDSRYRGGLDAGKAALTRRPMVHGPRTLVLSCMHRHAGISQLISVSWCEAASSIVAEAMALCTRYRYVKSGNAGPRVFIVPRRTATARQACRARTAKARMLRYTKRGANEIRTPYY